MIEDLRERVSGLTKDNIKLLNEKKELEDKYNQLKANQNVNTSIPALSGNTLRIKVVVNQIFREALQLRSSKIIYANLLIGASVRSKYL
jgi:hypothetical protein